MTEKICIDRAVAEFAVGSIEILNTGKWAQVAALITALRAALEQPQVEQEPIAWANINKQGDITHTSNKKMTWAKTPLYTHPQPPRQPLTDEAEHQCPYPKANPSTRNAWLDGWEAAERAHGIGGKV